MHSTIMFLGSRVLGFAGNARTKKTQQGTEKLSEHNRHTLFSRDFVLIMRASTGVVSTLFYGLCSLSFISSQFTPTSIFSSASVIVRPPPLWDGHKKE